MKKLNLFLLSVLVLCSVTIPAEGREKPSPADTPLSQQEKLDRGFIRVQTSAVSAFLSWRLQATDDEHTSFVILKNEVPVNTAPLRNATSYRPTLAKPTDVLKLVTLQNGEPIDTIEPKLFNDATHHVIQLKQPSGGTAGTGSEANDYTYTPNDCSVGDVDGDGEYELIVKWYPTNAKDNSQNGYTGYIIFDCYKIFTGERLWRIQLGKNIRAGAHYNQFLVYDFDGDGKAELICKTAPGSRDGKGQYVSEAATLDAIKNVSNGADYRVSGGRINGGHEYLTVFNGETGAAIHTIPYMPNRNTKYELSDAKGTFNWYMSSSKSDTGSYGNRGERYLAGVAFLDGPDKNPSAVMCRGMYTRSYLWAVNFDGEKLSTKWIHASLEDNTVQLTDGNGTTTTRTYTKQTGGTNSHPRYNAYGQGAHSLTIGDVDGDGCDEIIYGSATVDNDGWMLYSTGFGHGDAEHLGDLDPDRPGMEIFMVHEESPYGAHLIEAETGKVIWSSIGSEDNGRGLAANILDKNRGYEFWSAKVDNTRAVDESKTSIVSSTKLSMNFRIFWDGDALDELLDGTNIQKCTYNTSKTSIDRADMGVYTSKTAMKKFAEIAQAGGFTLSSCNSTKATPCLQADILGDWREEVIWYNASDPSQLILFTSTQGTSYRVPCLMYDHNYRMAIAWQQTGYNQPPHISYYLPDWIESFRGVADDIPDCVTTLETQNSVVAERQYFGTSGQRLSTEPTTGIYIERIINADGSSVVKKQIK